MSRYVDIESEFLKEWLRTETKKATQHTETLIEGKYLVYSPEGLNALINEILGLMPTVDVVEVVRCKDCTRQMICFHSDDYFCADGERREE